MRILDDAFAVRSSKPRAQNTLRGATLGDFGDREIEAVLLAHRLVRGALHDVEALAIDA